MRAPPDSADLELIGRFLARRDVAALEGPGSDRAGSDGAGSDRLHRPGPYDVLVLCGSAVLASLDVTAWAFHRRLVARVLVSGGIGHSTPYLVAAVRARPELDVPTDDRPEAAVLADLLVRHHGLPAAAVTTETASTNCGENAAFSLAALAGTGAGSVLLVQDPTMQRRTHAGFDFSQRDLAAAERVAVTSFAPLVPVVGPHGVGGSPGGSVVWTLERFTSLALGEVRRLRDDERGYGPRGAGFLGHVDVPAEVLDAAARVERTVEPGLRDR